MTTSSDLAGRILARASTCDEMTRRVCDAVMEVHHTVRELGSEDPRCANCDVPPPCETQGRMAEALGVAP